MGSVWCVALLLATPRPTLAGFTRYHAAMSRQRSHPDSPAPPGGSVIDAEFRVVGRRRRILGALWRGVLAVLIAAAIGFLIPPLWVLMESLGAETAK